MIGATIALDDLLAECSHRLDEEEPEMSCSAAVRAALATHRRAIALKYAEARDVVVIHQAADLTMVVMPTPPRFWFWPHEHGMWSVTAMLIGAEDDVVYGRRPHGLAERRRFHIDEGIVAALPADAIHAAGNDSDRVTLALHLFGGDPATVEALEWDPQTWETRLVDGVTAARRRKAMELV